jgi:hypothetical protein
MPVTPTEQKANSAIGSDVMLTSASELTPPVALEGDCPVTLLKETKWVKGDEQRRSDAPWSVILVRQQRLKPNSCAIRNIQPSLAGYPTGDFSPSKVVCRTRNPTESL